MQPKHLDYRMTQVLLIGEGQDDVSKALQSDAKDEKDDGKTAAQEEMEKLEAEDEHRVEGLKGMTRFCAVNAMISNDSYRR